MYLLKCVSAGRAALNRYLVLVYVGGRDAHTQLGSWLWMGCITAYFLLTSFFL